MDAFEVDEFQLDSIRRKVERQKMVLRTIVLVMKFIMIVATRFKEVQMQEKDKNEPTVDAEDYSSSDADSRPPLSKRRNVGTSPLGVTRNNDPVACAIANIHTTLEKMLDVMARSDNRDQLLATRRKMLLSELSMLPGVSDDDAIDASRVLLRSPTELENFFGCPNDEWKVRYVQRIIAQLRGCTSARQD